MKLKTILFLILLSTGLASYPQLTHATNGGGTMPWTDAYLSMSGVLVDHDAYATWGTNCWVLVLVAGDTNCMAPLWSQDLNTSGENLASPTGCGLADGSYTLSVVAWADGGNCPGYSNSPYSTIEAPSPFWVVNGVYYLFNIASIPSICAKQTDETNCNFYPSCKWNATTSICDYNQDAGLEDLTPPTDTCSFGDYGCQIKNFFTWFLTDSPVQINAVLGRIRTAVFSIWPIGYITRLVTILNTTTPIEPPAITYTVGNTIATTGITGSFTAQPFDSLTTIAGITEDTNRQTKNIWDIFMPFWNITVYLSLFMTILITLTHSHLGHTLEHGRKEEKKEENKEKK